MSQISIYADGGCSGNPGPGAWAYILLYDTSRIQASSGTPSTTNNRMELEAVISALIEVRRHPAWSKLGIDVFTDSRYVEQGITTWIRKWERNGWLNSQKKPVKNQDLWKRLQALSSSLTVRWRWLRGHAGDEMNEECHRLVQEAIKKIRK